jgi:hypothetical protein
MLQWCEVLERGDGRRQMRHDPPGGSTVRGSCRYHLLSNSPDLTGARDWLIPLVALVNQNEEVATVTTRRKQCQEQSRPRGEARGDPPKESHWLLFEMPPQRQARHLPQHAKRGSATEAQSTKKL